jgi:hypothetical protein
MARRPPRPAPRKFVSDKELGSRSEEPPEPSEWVVLSKAPRTHGFGGTTAKKVPTTAGCYEIGLSEPNKEPPTEWVVYVGVAGIGGGEGGLQRRLRHHAYGHNANTARSMDRALKRGYWVWARYYRAGDAEEARLLEKRLLRVGWWHYLWNRNETPPALLS